MIRRCSVKQSLVSVKHVYIYLVIVINVYIGIHVYIYNSVANEPYYQSISLK